MDKSKRWYPQQDWFTDKTLNYAKDLEMFFDYYIKENPEYFSKARQKKKRMRDINDPWEPSQKDIS